MEYICNICPRKCNVLRNDINSGYCKMPYEIMISKYSLHKWEEPCISGINGSGTIFFSGCNLGCVYCQNYEISHQKVGKIVTKQELVDIFNELILKGAHNINLVTPTHYVYILKEILEENTFSVPIVYNCGGYEDIANLKLLNGLIDIYLTDLKYYSDELSMKYSKAPNYFNIATEAIFEMYNQVGNCEFDEKGILKKGVIVRHLILPNNTKNTIEVLRWCKNNLSKDIYISVMTQYVPMGDLTNTPELQRKINKIEYNKVVKYMYENNIENGYIQDMQSASKKYIPDFNM